MVVRWSMSRSCKRRRLLALHIWSYGGPCYDSLVNAHVVRLTCTQVAMCQCNAFLVLIEPVKGNFNVKMATIVGKGELLLFHADATEHSSIFYTFHNS